MDGSRLLDTSVVFAAFEQPNDYLKQMVKDANCYITATVVGELMYGAFNSVNQKQNLARIDRLRNRLGYLPCDFETARIYGRTKAELRAKGRPIPDNDIWIAAPAIQYSLTLVTRDKHFNFVDGLSKQYA